MTTNVSPIPKGYHTATPYLIIRGAAQAIEYYQKAFGAREITRMAGPDGKIMHAEIQIGDSMIMLADENPAWDVKSPQALGGSPVSVFLYVPDVDATFQQAVTHGATANMPVQDMFWGDRFGKLTDPFGHVWEVATHKEDLTLEEIMERSKKAMSQGAGA